MADQPTTPSGSRWEPDPDATTPTAETRAVQREPDEHDGAAELDPALEAAPVGGPAGDDRRTTARDRAVLAGAATALAVGGGIAGFVIGHSTAGNDSNGFSPAGFTGPRNSGQPNGSQLGEGQQPPAFGHDGGRDGDPNGDDGFGPAPGSTDGGPLSNGSGNGAGTTGNPA